MKNLLDIPVRGEILLDTVSLWADWQNYKWKEGTGDWWNWKSKKYQRFYNDRRTQYFKDRGQCDPCFGLFAFPRNTAPTQGKRPEIVHKIPLLMFMGFPYNYTGEMVIALLDT